MEILYLGSIKGTSRHRINALGRIGHNVISIDPSLFLPSNSIARKFLYETGGFLYEKQMRKSILLVIGNRRFDLVWVDAGSYVGPSLVAELRNRFGKILNYNLDDPFGNRDRYHWRMYLKAVPEYNLIVVVRKSNIAEAYAAGAKKVVQFVRTADEIAHSPREINSAEIEQYGSDVLFIGTWFPERGPFMMELLKRKVPLTIIGDRWNKASEWASLKKAWKMGGTTHDDVYAKLIQCSKLTLGLLSKGNRDLHTHRSVEIPQLGGVLCAERTTEHEELYKDNQEAVFWTSAEECAAKSIELLSNPLQRKIIAQSGRQRCFENQTQNEILLKKIISQIL